MFIKQKDYAYLMTLYNTLDTDAQKRFETRLLKAIGKRTGQELHQAIHVVTDQIRDEQAVGSQEWVTRTMIHTIYKQVKGDQGSKP